ncbi:hypothetical protein ANCDUO_22086, partial [Ancylostoma duodenale]
AYHVQRAEPVGFQALIVYNSEGKPPIDMAGSKYADLIFKAIRLCRERRRVARKRLSKRNLRKIPTKKFRKGELI